MGRLLLAAACLVAVSAGLCWGGTIYVKPDGTGDVPTIAAAFVAAGVGDTVLLASGTFGGDGNHDLTIPAKNLVIKSETGDPADCVVDCQGASGVHTWGFAWGACNAVIEGLAVTNATGAGLNLSESAGSATVRNCAFIANGDPYYWPDAGAIHIDGHDGDAVITDCRFVSNAGGVSGGAVYICGVWLEVTINRCTFSGNWSGWGGAICCDMHEAVAYIRNSVFYENWAAGYGGAIAVINMSAEITGCTFFANSAPDGSGIAFGTNGMDVSNCIVANGTGGCGIAFSGEYPWLYCTDIYGNEGGDWVGTIAGLLGQNGNFSAPPGFCYWETEPYDLRLCSGSLCLPGNHPDGASCGLIGALGQGCECGPTALEPTTWGAIKAMYR